MKKRWEKKLVLDQCVRNLPQNSTAVIFCLISVQSIWLKKMDVTNIEYDVAIIGAGMIGSAAAKYASEDVKTSILIGPDQPQDGIHSGIQK